jgi:ATP phosphoribosyltransferase
MLRVALPNKGTLAEPAAQMMRDAGYRQRVDSRDLSVLDEENGVEFFYLRPKDIATYVGAGDLAFGITGHDLMEESGSPVRRVMDLGFGRSQFRFAVHEDKDWKFEDLDGRAIATSYPRLVRSHLAAKGIRAEKIVKLDGAVEIAIQLGLAEAIADVVSSGRTLRQHNLKVVGEPIATSEAGLIEREPRHDRLDPPDVLSAKPVFANRLLGVVYARRYVMIDYDCPGERLEEAEALTPGAQGATIAPLAKDGWFGVRAMVTRAEVNYVMDRLSAVGATAILTTEIRSCRAIGDSSVGYYGIAEAPPPPNL